MEKLEVTKAEKNRLIAEWIEPMPNGYTRKADLYGRTDIGAWLWREDLGQWDHRKGRWIAADFYAAEAASALALEKMPEPELWLESQAGDPQKMWGCKPDMNDRYGISFNADRKAAIAEAAYRVAMKAKEKA